MWITFEEEQNRRKMDVINWSAPAARAAAETCVQEIQTQSFEITLNELFIAY